MSQYAGGKPIDRKQPQPCRPQAQETRAQRSYSGKKGEFIEMQNNAPAVNVRPHCNCAIWLLSHKGESGGGCVWRSADHQRPRGSACSTSFGCWKLYTQTLETEPVILAQANCTGAVIIKPELLGMIELAVQK